MAKHHEVTKQNPWWKHGKNFINFEPLIGGKHFTRKECPLERGNIYMLRGPRQVGKTIYIRDTISKLMEKGVNAKDIFRLSVDFFPSRRELRSAVENFLISTRDSGRIYIFLDEITSLEDWHLELKYLSDQRIKDKAVIFVTGSSPKRLRELSDSIPGRGLEGNEYYLKPLSFRQFAIQAIEYIMRFSSQIESEFRASLEKLNEALTKFEIDLDMEVSEMIKIIDNIAPFKSEVDFLFELYSTCGGYPSVINDFLKNRFEGGKKAIDRYKGEVIIKDVLDELAKVGKSSMLAREVLRAVINRYCSRSSFLDIAREIERNHPTAINYLKSFEESFLFFVHWAYDFGRNDVKMKGDKKVYFFDPFVYYAVTGYLEGREVTDVFVEKSEDEDIMGKIVEAMVVSHILMHKEIPYIKEKTTFLWHYYDKSKREIDALFKSAVGFLGIEVKYGRSVPKVRDISQVNYHLVLSKDDLDLNKMVVPVDLFLSLLGTSERNL